MTTTSPNRSGAHQLSASPRLAKAVRTRAASRRLTLGHWNDATTSYYLLLGSTILLVIIGLAMVLSSTAVNAIASGLSPWSQFFSQAQFAVMGLIGLIVAMRIPLRWYKKIAWPALLAAMALQSLTFHSALVASQGDTGAWIVIPGTGISLQPSEFGKLALALWIGVVLGRKQQLLGRWRHAIIPAVPGVVLYMGLVTSRGDLSSALIMVFMLLGALWISGASWSMLGLFSAGGAISVVMLFLLGQGTGNRINRIMAFMDPECDPLGLCYQFTQGRLALGSGGIFGVGLGASRQRWGLLPDADNDFIFAIIGEELGLLGTLMVLSLFVAIGVAMVRVIRRHEDMTAKIVTAAVVSWILGQAFINIAVVLGLLPVLGQPLPLVSAGGSALITSMTAIGMVLSFARTEPGAALALAAKESVVKKSMSIVSGTRPSLPSRKRGSTSGLSGHGKGARPGQSSPAATASQASALGRRP